MSVCVLLGINRMRALLPLAMSEVMALENSRMPSMQK